MAPEVVLATIDLVANIKGSTTSTLKLHDKHLLEHLVVD
jgi:hypothetical protein